MEYYQKGGLSAALYDILTQSTYQVGDVEFYVDLVRGAGGSVLELGCGTGRITLPLALSGSRVVGVDLSQPMIAQAVKKCHRLPTEVSQRISLILGDMTTVEVPSVFDCVIVPFYAFSHLPDHQSRARALATLSRHLRPGGSAAIHIPTLDELTAPLGQFVTSGWVNDGELRAQIRGLDREFNALTGRFCQRMGFTVEDKRGGMVHNTVENIVYHWFEEGELTSLADRCGLHLERIVNSFGLGMPKNGQTFILRRR